jgi:hypothetical protein
MPCVEGEGQIKKVECGRHKRDQSVEKHGTVIKQESPNKIIVVKAESSEKEGEVAAGAGGGGPQLHLVDKVLAKCSPIEGDIQVNIKGQCGGHSRRGFEAVVAAVRRHPSASWCGGGDGASPPPIEMENLLAIVWRETKLEARWMEGYNTIPESCRVFPRGSDWPRLTAMALWTVPRPGTPAQSGGDLWESDLVQLKATPRQRKKLVKLILGVGICDELGALHDDVMAEDAVPRQRQAMIIWAVNNGVTVLNQHFFRPSPSS